MIHFDIPKLEEELKELEEKTMQDGFWNDQKNSNKVLSEISVPIWEPVFVSCWPGSR